MAALRRSLAAQEDRSAVEGRSRQHRLDPALGHEREKASLVGLPVAVALLEVVEEPAIGRQERFVRVLGAHEPREEERQVARLREARQLRRIVEPNVEQALDAGLG